MGGHRQASGPESPRGAANGLDSVQGHDPARAASAALGDDVVVRTPSWTLQSLLCLPKDIRGVRAAPDADGLVAQQAPTVAATCRCPPTRTGSGSSCLSSPSASAVSPSSDQESPAIDVAHAACVQLC